MMMFSPIPILLALLCVAATSAQDTNSKIFIDGTLYNDLGEPLPNAVLQVWQTDEHGVYDHPNSIAQRGALEPDFQYFGTSTTDANGLFSFVTFRPGVYQGRPTHIHFKVVHESEELLTSQFYFADEPDRGTPESLRLALEPHATEPDAFAAAVSVTVDTGMGGSAELSPVQPEGPFYPVVDFASADGDLTVVGSTTTSIPTSGSSSATATATSTTTTEGATTTTITNTPDTQRAVASSTTSTSVLAVLGAMVVAALG